MLARIVNLFKRQAGLSGGRRSRGNTWAGRTILINYATHTEIVEVA